MVNFGLIFSFFILFAGGYSRLDEKYVKSKTPIKKLWGIQDVSTSVGRLFEFIIPTDAFTSSVHHYEVTSSSNSPLPEWMFYSEKHSKLLGVPSSQDFGDHEITVKAFDPHGNHANVTFVVEVYPLLEKNTNHKRKCKKGESVSMISLVIDRTMSSIPAPHRVYALKMLAEELKLRKDDFLMLDGNYKAELVTESLKGTPNDTCIITWQTGCNDEIWSEMVNILSFAQHGNINATLTKIIDLPVIQFKIISLPSPFRFRRHVQSHQNVTSTTDEISGEDDDEGDPDDYDPEEDDNTLNTSSPGVVKPDFFRPNSYSNSSLDTVTNNKPIGDRIKKEETLPFDDSSLNFLPVEEEGITESGDDFLDSEDTNNFNDTSFLNDTMKSTIDNSMSTSSPAAVNLTVTSGVNTTASPVAVTLPTNSTEKAIISENPTSVIPKRTPPRVVRRLNAIQVFAGKPFKEKIPADVFFDQEDGGTSNLTLKLKKPDNSTTPDTSWIEMNSETQEIYMLPTPDHISKYEFAIEAIDSDGGTATNELSISVQYPKKTRAVNIEFTLHTQPREGARPTVARQMELMDSLATLYGDANATNMTVRSVAYEPFAFTWTNDTLSVEECDNRTIAGLLNVLTDGPWSMNVNRNVQYAIGDDLIAEKVTWRALALCENIIPLARPPLPEKQNFKPVLVNHIDNITARVGELFVLKIPEDTFYDADVKAGNLKMELMTFDSLSIPSDNWLQFDSVNQELYGLPMARDVGTVSYQLVCHDDADNSELMKERHVIEAIVRPAAKTYYSAEFAMKLRSSYERFSTTPLVRRQFVERVAALFGDANASAVVVSGYAPGSVDITWHNRSLSVDECPEAELERLRRILLDEDGSLRERVNKALAPEFEVISAKLTPIGVCEGGLTEVRPPAPADDSESNEILAIIPSAEYFTNYILPIAIIVLMMLIAGLIACVLYRRQKRGKWHPAEDDEEPTYHTKGIPVIFQDELEERLEPTNNSPIIMKEEKPPLPPPEYQKTMPLPTTALLSDFDDGFPQRTNGRSKTPIYRKPPPYITS